MSTGAGRPVSERRELGRGERVIPGLWRLRLPLPWPGVPHCNAWAVAAGSGIVLVDTGMHQPGSMAQLERAMDQVRLRVENVQLLVCTHAHTDHWGQAAPICERAGSELWMHPDHGHATHAAGDPGSRWPAASRWDAKAACPSGHSPATRNALASSRPGSPG
jgi:glyoxylase-like metal-dependent hydrolase (beta-lactamase superfamily II)